MPDGNGREQRASLLLPALVLLAAGLFGILALPRLAPDPTVGKPAADFLLPRVGARAKGEARPNQMSTEGRRILDFGEWCCRSRQRQSSIGWRRPRGARVVALGSCW